MARQATEGKSDAMRMIREHLATKGKDGVNDLRDKFFAHVPKGTWYNWVLQAKETPYSPEDMQKARDVLAATIEDPGLLDREMSRVIPPAPATIAEIGPQEARRSLNLINRFEHLYQDCLMVRKHSVKVAAEGGGEEIKLMRSFVQSITLRNGILNSVMAALEKLWNMQKMQEFHDAIIDEVRKESPECAARIVARITRLSESSGIADTGHRI